MGGGGRPACKDASSVRLRGGEEDQYEVSKLVVPTAVIEPGPCSRNVRKVGSHPEPRVRPKPTPDTSNIWRKRADETVAITTEHSIYIRSPSYIVLTVLIRQLTPYMNWDRGQRFRQTLLPPRRAFQAFHHRSVCARNPVTSFGNMRFDADVHQNPSPRPSRIAPVVTFRC